MGRKAVTSKPPSRVRTQLEARLYLVPAKGKNAVWELET